MSNTEIPARTPLRSWALEFARRWNAGARPFSCCTGTSTMSSQCPTARVGLRAAESVSHAPAFPGARLAALLRHRRWAQLRLAGDAEASFSSGSRCSIAWRARTFRRPGRRASSPSSRRFCGGFSCARQKRARRARTASRCIIDFPEKIIPASEKRRQCRGADGARHAAEMGGVAGDAPARCRRDSRHGIRAGTARRSAAQSARRADPHRPARRRRTAPLSSTTNSTPRRAISTKRRSSRAPPG